MSRSTDDRLVWLTVAFGLAVAFLYIPATLERVRTLTEVHNDKDDVKQLTEAALKPEVLRVLADGPSYELRASAMKIITTQALSGSGKKILLRDLASKNADDRRKAIDAISMMLFTRRWPNHNPVGAAAADALCDLPSFTAIVDALINCLPLHDITAEPPLPPLRKPTQAYARGSGPVSPLLPPHRPADEKRLLQILYELLTYNHMSFSHSESIPLQAGIVKRWLNHYPFPCAQASNFHLGFCRSDVVTLFGYGAKSWANDDPPMAKIFHTLTHEPEAQKHLRECGLKASSYKEAITSSCGNSGWSELPSRDVLMTNSEDTAGLWSGDNMRHEQVLLDMRDITGEEILEDGPVRRRSPGRPGSSWAQQAPERSLEGDNLRRRHREAIVVAEMGAPFTRENILERQNSRMGLTPLVEPRQDM